MTLPFACDARALAGGGGEGGEEGSLGKMNRRQLGPLNEGVCVLSHRINIGSESAIHRFLFFFTLE